MHCRHNFVNVFDFCVYFSVLFSYNLYTGADLKSTLMHKAKTANGKHKTVNRLQALCF